MIRLKPFLFTAILALLFLLWPLGFESGEAHSSPWTGFIASLHPLILHLPIGIVFAIGVAELSIGLRKKGPWETLNLLWSLSAFTASLSFATGYFLGEAGGYEASILNNHLWAAGVFTALCWVSRGLVRKQCSKLIRFALLATTAIAMIVAGHYGGIMVHGDPLAAAPWKEKAAAIDILPPLGDEFDAYADLVQPLLAAKCQQCHGPEKKKGKFRLDTYERLMAGGTDLAIEAGDSEFSLLIEMIELPLDDEEHMPPEDEVQLNEAERALLKWWIDAGAQESHRFTKTDAPAVIEPFLVPEYRLLPDPALLARQAAAETQRLAAAQALRQTRAELVTTLPESLRGHFSFSSQTSSELSFRPAGSPNAFTDELLIEAKAALAECSRIDFSSTSISPEAFSQLKLSKHLQRISLRSTAIDASALAMLANASSLESLNLFSIKLADSDIEQLPALPNLKRLYVGNTKLTDDGFDVLRSKYPSCNVIGNLKFEQ